MTIIICKLIHVDCHWTIHKFSHMFGIHYGVCQKIFLEHLNMYPVERHLKAETFWCLPHVCKKYIRNILFNAVKGTHFIRLMQEFSSTTSYSIIFKDVIFKYIFFLWETGLNVCFLAVKSGFESHYSWFYQGGDLLMLSASEGHISIWYLWKVSEDHTKN